MKEKLGNQESDNSYWTKHYCDIRNIGDLNGRDTLGLSGGSYDFQTRLQESVKVFATVQLLICLQYAKLDSGKGLGTGLP